MPTELEYLVASVGLFIVMIVVQALIGLMSGHSPKFLAGPRDGMEDKTLKAQRARRANANMIEGMLLFVPLVLVAAHLGRFNEMTALGAALFFWGRLAYAPLYWLGVPWLRTLAWAVSILGILMIFLQVLPFA